jgi:hypothetical protein
MMSTKKSVNQRSEPKLFPPVVPLKGKGPVSKRDDGAGGNGYSLVAEGLKQNPRRGPARAVARGDPFDAESFEGLYDGDHFPVRCASQVKASEYQRKRAAGKARGEVGDIDYARVGASGDENEAGRGFNDKRLLENAPSKFPGGPKTFHAPQWI